MAFPACALKQIKDINNILRDHFKDNPRLHWFLLAYIEGDTSALLTKFARKSRLAHEGVDVIFKSESKVLQDAATGYYDNEG